MKHVSMRHGYRRGTVAGRGYGVGDRERGGEKGERRSTDVRSA